MDPEPEQQQRSYSGDLERGPQVLDPRRQSNLSAGGDGIGSALSSNSSIMGEDFQGDMGEEWGPQHPCFPHMNPHVPVHSPEYQATRIIRIHRDWLIEGDLAPTFSNLYPEILDPAGLSEQEFRRVIDKLNGELVPIFSPYSFRNVLDAVLGLATGWLWDDFGFTAVKARLKRLESWMDQWNKEMEKTVGSEEGATPPKLIPLRRTGYMTVCIPFPLFLPLFWMLLKSDATCLVFTSWEESANASWQLDIQISDPEVAPAPSTPGASRSGAPEEPPAAVTT